jgi:hypothetical protein
LINSWNGKDIDVPEGAENSGKCFEDQIKLNDTV